MMILSFRRKKLLKWNSRSNPRNEWEENSNFSNIGLRSLEGLFIVLHSHAHSSKCVSTNLDHICTLFIMTIVKPSSTVFLFFSTATSPLSPRERCVNFHSLHLFELDVHLDRRVVDTHLALTHLVHATWPRFELFILWQRIYIIYISDRVRRCPISRSIGTSVERSFLHFLVARICLAHETWNCTIGCMIRERIGRERRKGLLNGRAVETPRAEIWTTMSAVRRGGRKNCGGARRPQEDV